LSYRVATRRHCLILLKNRSIKLRARYKYGLKQIGSLRFRFGGMFAHALCWWASSLIQSASYPRSASNIVFGSKALRRAEHSRLSCASPGVSARDGPAGHWCPPPRESCSSSPLVSAPYLADCCRRRRLRAGARGQPRYRSFAPPRHGRRPVRSQTPARRHRTKRL
jgi:hypothetical protein